jgi:competence protein ComEC
MLHRAAAHLGRTLGLAFVALAALLLPVCAQSMRVHFIDVGQGASTLIEFPCAAVLVDTGGESNQEFESNDALKTYLDKFFAQHPDFHRTLHSLILTHPHIDHTNGVPTVLGRYKILNAVTNGQETSEGGPNQHALHQKIAEAEATDDTSDDIGFVVAEVHKIPKNRGLTNNVIDPVACPTVDPKITLLWGASRDNPGWSQKAFNNENNHSVVVRVDFGAASLLITGDLQEEAIEDLIEHYQASSLLRADVYEVGHHGSANGSTDKLLQAIRPKIAVMEMGPPTRELDWTAWAYGHPRKTIVDLLAGNVTGVRDLIKVKVATAPHTFVTQKIESAIYGTGWDGALVFETDVKGNWKHIQTPSTPAPHDGVAAAGGSRINLNTAGVAELAGLPHVGQVRAQAIVDYRTRNGPFRSIDDLDNVRGIGPATLLRLRNLLTIAP